MNDAVLCAIGLNCVVTNKIKSGHGDEDDSLNIIV